MCACAKLVHHSSVTSKTSCESDRIAGNFLQFLFPPSQVVIHLFRHYDHRDIQHIPSSVLRDSRLRPGDCEKFALVAALFVRYTPAYINFSTVWKLRSVSFFDSRARVFHLRRALKSNSRVLCKKFSNFAKMAATTFEMDGSVMEGVSVHSPFFFCLILSVNLATFSVSI